MDDKIINLEIPLSDLNKLFAVLGEQKMIYEQKYTQVTSLISLVQNQSVPQINTMATEKDV